MTLSLLHCAVSSLFIQTFRWKKKKVKCDTPDLEKQCIYSEFPLCFLLPARLRLGMCVFVGVGTDNARDRGSKRGRRDEEEEEEEGMGGGGGGENQLSSR